MGFFKNAESQAMKRKKPSNLIAWLCLAVVSPAVALSGCSPALPESFQVGNPKITKKTYMKKNLKLTQELVCVRASVATFPPLLYYTLLFARPRLCPLASFQTLLRSLQKEF